MHNNSVCSNVGVCLGVSEAVYISWSEHKWEQEEENRRNMSLPPADYSTVLQRRRNFTFMSVVMGSANKPRQSGHNKVLQPKNVCFKMMYMP